MGCAVVAVTQDDVKALLSSRAGKFLSRHSPRNKFYGHAGGCCPIAGWPHALRLISPDNERACFRVSLERHPIVVGVVPIPTVPVEHRV